MPFRARLNPAALSRRRAAALAFRATPLARMPAPAAGALPSAPLFPTTPGGPGPSSLRSYATPSAPRAAFGSFFRRQSRPDPVSPTAAVMAALAPGMLETLRSSYAALMGRIAADPSTPRLTSDELALLLETVAARASPSALPLLREIWEDMEVHGVEPEPRHTRAFVYGLATHGAADEALALVLDGVDAGPREWLAIAEGTPADVLNGVLKAAAERGVLSERMYGPLLAAAADDAAVLDVLGRMTTDGIDPGLWSARARVATYLRSGDVGAAREAVALWSPNAEDDELAQALWQTAIEVHMTAKDVPAVERAMREMNGHPPPHAFVFLVQQRLSDGADGSRIAAPEVLDAVHHVAYTTGHVLPAPAWTRLIADLVGDADTHGLETALDVYRASQSHGSVASFPLALVLIRALCEQRPPALGPAMEVYDDLLIAADANAFDYTLQPRGEMYEALLGACAASSPPNARAALGLAGDMAQRGQRLRARAVAPLVVDLFRGAKDHYEAFNIYSRLHAVANGPLTERAYDAIITAFIAASFPEANAPRTPPPAEHVISMMRDMRAAGHRPGTRILTSLLKAYATAAKGTRRLPLAEARFQLSALLSAVRDVHTLVSLDPLIDVDVPLLTALMDAFSSSKAYVEALDVWAEIVNRRAGTDPAIAPQLFSAAINVALDTCAHAELLPRARKVWAWGHRHGLIRETKNWETWIECLARLGRLDEATYIVCVDMGHDGVPQPTKEIAGILYKFAWRRPREIKQVEMRVQQRFPQWAEELGEIVRTKAHCTARK